MGYIRAEPDNPYDKNAIAIYRNDKKLLGYIPKDEVEDFRKWSGNKEEVPCVGFIKAGDEVPVFGKVKAINDGKDETELTIVKYVKWLISNLGLKYIPVGFDVNTTPKPRTKKDWIEFLNRYIEEKEEDLYE